MHLKLAKLTNANSLPSISAEQKAVEPILVPWCTRSPPDHGGFKKIEGVTSMFGSGCITSILPVQLFYWFVHLDDRSRGILSLACPLDPYTPALAIEDHPNEATRVPLSAP